MERTRATLKEYFETGDKPTQAQFEELIDSMFCLAEDGGAKVKYLLEQLQTLSRLNKSAVRGADFALNRRGAVEWDDPTVQAGLVNILPGDFYVYSKVTPTENDDYVLGDILVFLTSTPGNTPWILTNKNNFWIIRAGLINAAVTMSDDDRSDIAENDILISTEDETRQVKGSGKRIDDSAAKNASILWTSNKFGDAALKNTGTASGTVAAGNDERFGVANDGSITDAKLHTSLKSRSALSGVSIDWSTASIFTKTLTAATELEFTNLQLNKVITLLISGNYSLLLPDCCKAISGIYSPASLNYISFHCTNATEGSEEVWYSVSQDMTDE